MLIPTAIFVKKKLKKKIFFACKIQKNYMVLTVSNLNCKINIVVLLYCISVIYKHNARITHDRQTLIKSGKILPNKQKNKDYFAIMKPLIFKFKII